MTDAPKPTRDEINTMRLRAFKTNHPYDIREYYRACSGWFQDEDYRELDRADLSRDLVRAALERAATEADRFTNPALVFRAKRASGEPKLRFTAEEVMLEIRSVAQAIADRTRSNAKDDEAVAALITSVLGEAT